MSLDLLDEYGHDILTSSFSRVEEVFLNEIKTMEDIATELISDDQDVSSFLTITDTSMQKQAYLTQEIWMEASKFSVDQEIINIISALWAKNYTVSLNKMKAALLSLNDISGSTNFRDKIVDIALDICKSRIDAAGVIGKQISSAEEKYQNGKKLIMQGEYLEGFIRIQKAFTESDMLIKGYTSQNDNKLDSEKNETATILLSILAVFLVLIIFIIVSKKKRD